MYKKFQRILVWSSRIGMLGTEVLPCWVTLRLKPFHVTVTEYLMQGDV
jgi:hypothetical protein